MADNPKKPDVFKVARLYVRVVATLQGASDYVADMYSEGCDGAEIYEAAKLRIAPKTGAAITDKDCYVVVAWDNAGGA